MSDRSTAAVWALLAGTAAGVLLVLLAPVHGLVDGALHLNGALVLRDAVDGLEPPFSDFLRWAPGPVPNLLPEVALALLTFPLKPEWAERTLVLAYVVTFPLAFLYAMRGVRSGADWLALVALPLTFTFSLHYGFYNFSFSVVMFLVVAGYTLRLKAPPGVRDVLGLLGLLALTYLTHLVGFVEALLFVTVLMIARSRAAGRATRSSLAIAAAACGFVVLALIAVRAGSLLPSSLGEKPKEVLATLTLGWGLVTFSTLEIVLAALLAVVLALLGGLAILARQPRLSHRSGDELLVFTSASFFCVVLSPGSIESGGSLITQRLALFPALGIALWLAAQPLSAAALRRAGLACGVIALALASARLPSYRELARNADDVVTAAPCIATGSTMLQASLHLPHLDHPSWRIYPLSDETARLAADTGGLDLGNVEWSVPYYLLRFREERDPYELIPNPAGAIEAIPPAFDLSGYERRTGGRVDYLVVIGRDRAADGIIASREWRRLRADLGRRYRLVHRSPRGWAETWERRVASVERAGAARRSQTGCRLTTTGDR